MKTSRDKARKKKSIYVNYDYEATFTEALRDGEDTGHIKALLNAGHIKSIYATKTIKSGRQFEVEIYPEFTRKQAAAMKLKKNHQAQKNLNDKNSRKRAQRLINANFTNGDYWITLTYTPENLPPDIETAQKDMQNYIRRVNYRRKKEGLSPAKYLYITEHGEKEKRIHHHVIINSGLDADTLESLWTKGKRNNVRRLAEDENGLAGLSQYLTKDPKGRKRWKSSKNLKKPIESKSYSRFKFGRIRRMIENQNLIQTELEKEYKGRRFSSAEVRYNDNNGRFYIYARMAYESSPDKMPTPAKHKKQVKRYRQ